MVSGTTRLASVSYLQHILSADGCASQVAELDARLASALTAWQGIAGEEQLEPPIGTAPDASALLAAVVAADTALTGQQLALDSAERAASAALERVRRARDRVARCQARLPSACPLRGCHAAAPQQNAG